MYIVLKMINEYDQEGAYFVAAYEDVPTPEQLTELLPNDDEESIQRLLTTGGGRRKSEYEWYYLVRVEDGQVIDDNDLYKLDDDAEF